MINAVETIDSTAPSRTEADRSRVRADAEVAGSVIAKSWPLETFIAVNPLRSLEQERFEEAVRIAGQTLGARGTMSEGWYRKQRETGRIGEEDLRSALRRRLGDVLNSPPLAIGRERFSPEAIFLTDLMVGEEAPAPVRTYLTASERFEPGVFDQMNEESSKWCAAYLGAESAGWPMPGRELGFYSAWRELIGLDRSLPAKARKALTDLPDRPEDALLDAIEKIGVPSHANQDYLRSHVGAMPGWTSLVIRISETDEGIDLVSYLAMRVAIEAALLEAKSVSLPVPYIHPDSHDGWQPAPERGRTVAVLTALGALPGSNQDELSAIDGLLAKLPPRERTQIWQEAYEENYRSSLLHELERPRDETEERPDAQLVCCIDVRSEGLRRKFEECGNYETLGFAGFFGVPIRYQDLAGNSPSDLCPVLIEPKSSVFEEPLQGAEKQSERRLARENSVTSAKDGVHEAESNVIAPFALAEMSGWIKGPVAAARTLATRPFGSIRSRLREKTVPAAPTVIDVERDMPLDERVLFAEVALKTMGLTDNFAKVVILCAHGSTTENNPYASALDCGACGGHRGAPNARAAAAILNREDVRELLVERGLEIPGDTFFVAAEHDTTIDRVEILEPELVPEAIKGDLDRISRDLDAATGKLSLERSRDLPGEQPKGKVSRAEAGVYRRSQDWAEVYPEWGLAGNAAFIIGPREMTAGVDLGRRTFLHSYDPNDDAQGEALETILTAPVVVAQWINCQYYFSTVEPVVFGAGTKVTHNPVGNVGVLSGPDGDLKLGLPWQSLADGDRLVHEPMRLLVVIEAPLDRITTVIERNPSVRDLFDNGWLSLAAREDATSGWMRRERNSEWTPWETR